MKSGCSKDWNKAINNPAPNTSYLVDGRYVYETDKLGRVEKVEGKLTDEVFDRNKYQQCKAGKCGIEVDEGGHLIASIFGGAGEKLNLVPMNGNLNKGEWKKMENLRAEALDEGKTVEVKILPKYDKEGVRPTSIKVEYTIEVSELLSRI